MSNVFKFSGLLVILLLLIMVPMTMAQEDQGNMVSVSLTEFNIDMPASVPAGRVVFEVTNNGTMEHNFEVEGQGIEEVLETNLQPGESGILEVDLQPGTYEVYCPVGNHREQGMELQLNVTEAQAQTTPEAEETATPETMDATQAVTGTETTTDTGAMDATGAVTGTETTAGDQPAAAATPQVTTLPQTGGELSPWLALLLLALGALFLIGGLTLALARRTR